MEAHLPNIATANREPVDEDDHSSDSDVHYSRKTVKLPSDWGTEDDETTKYIVEIIYNETSGGRINIWTDEKSTLEHIWKPTTHNGEDYRKCDEVHFWDYPNAVDEYKNINTASDVVDLMGRNA